MREDHYTNTVEDAAAYERERGMAEDVDYDRPTAAEAEADLWHAGPDTVIGYGIRCAHCHNRHATVDDVRWCADLHAEARAEALAEQAAEAAAERFFEEGPESFQMMRAAEEAFEASRAWNDPWA